MKSRLTKRIQLLALAIAIALIAMAFSPTSTAVAITEQVTYHYYNGPDETSDLVGERVNTCDGHVERWGQITQYYTVDTAPCP
jgi:Family of unknown function (DUF6289)